MNQRCMGGYPVVSWSKYEEVALVHLIAGDIGYNPLTDWGFYHGYNWHTSGILQFWRTFDSKHQNWGI